MEVLGFGWRNGVEKRGHGTSDRIATEEALAFKAVDHFEWLLHDQISVHSSRNGSRQKRN
jgi:hypothetical protein